MEIHNAANHNPYSVQGATVNGLLSVGYLNGKHKTNSGVLMPDHALPDFSGIKLDTSGPVISLPQSGAVGTQTDLAAKPRLDTVTIETTAAEKATDQNIASEEPLQMYTLTQSGEVKLIEPKYNLHGVVFSSEEITAAKEYLEGMTGIMRDNGVFSLTLDYDDYALMGLGESQIRAFGKEQGFSDEQTQALVTDYRESIRKMVEKNLSEFPFDRQVTELPFSQYFFVYQSEEFWAGDHHVKKGTPVSTPELAVNWEMIRDVYEMMAGVDQSNDGSLKSAESRFEQEAITARSAGMVDPSWSKWRVGIYMENIEKVESAMDSFRAEMSTKHPHLDTKA